jgi:peptidoglycan/xylan/chitin deacetylase (PgdA/CDA1 family)
MRLAGGDRQRVATLCYHSVHPRHPHASVTADGFRRQLEWLTCNCEIVPFEQIKSIADREVTGTPVVAITFDDAFADNYVYAWPVLREFAVPATFFITTGLVERQSGVVARFARLLDVSESLIEPLTWSQIDEMRDSGMTIGAHSVTHPNLAYIDDGAARWEIEASRDRLEAVLGDRISSFAYPFGKPKHNVKSRTVDLVRQAGFDTAGAIHCRTTRSNEDPLRLPRIPINHDSLERLRALIMGGEDWLGWWQERAPEWLSHTVSPAGSHRGEGSLRCEGAGCKS